MDTLIYTDNKWDGTSEQIAHHRVKENGEVLTPANIVSDMLNMITPDLDIESTILEPSCGTGNFMVQFLERKLIKCTSEVDMLVAVSSIYGVDIARDNVTYTRKRLLGVLIKHGYEGYALECASKILELNIVWGNTLTGLVCKSGTTHKPCMVCNDYDEAYKTNREVTVLNGSVIPSRLRFPSWGIEKFKGYFSEGTFVSHLAELYEFEYFDDSTGTSQADERRQMVENIDLEDLF